MITLLLTVWIGIMVALALLVAWLLVSRFPEVFFQSRNWRDSAEGRRVRMVLLVGAGVGVITAGVSLVLFFVRRA